MNLINFLEQLANNAHHRAEVRDVLGQQTNEVQRLFLTNDVAGLKGLLGDSGILADRSTVSI